MKSTSRPFTIESLRARLQEAEQTLQAIRTGEVDALVVSGPAGDQVFSLRGADAAGAGISTVNVCGLGSMPIRTAERTWSPMARAAALGLLAPWAFWAPALPAMAASSAAISSARGACGTEGEEGVDGGTGGCCMGW